MNKKIMKKQYRKMIENLVKSLFEKIDKLKGKTNDSPSKQYKNLEKLFKMLLLQVNHLK